MNYNTLRNKPTINYRELIGDNTVSEVGGITEEEFDQLLDTDLASYYNKAEIDELFARSYVFREKSGSIVTFDCPTSTPAFAQILSEIVAVQSGTGDPSPTNIRPISGWSECNVMRCENNFYSATLADYSSTQVVGVGLATFYPIKVPYGTYTISTNAPTGYIWAGYNINDSSTLPRVYEGNPNTVTTDIIWVGLLTSDISSAYAYNIMINQGSTPSSYEAYNGTTYTTTLKDGQGNPLTCYGGGLMNAGGSQALLVTKGHIASYNGETLPSTWISDRDVYAEGTTPSIGAEVVYELETPLQIPQDSLSIVSTGGINNIWCDSGDITVKALDRIIQG